MAQCLRIIYNAKLAWNYPHSKYILEFIVNGVQDRSVISILITDPFVENSCNAFRMTSRLKLIECIRWGWLPLLMAGYIDLKHLICLR